MPEQKERRQTEMAKSERRLRRVFKTRKTERTGEEKPQAISQGGFPSAGWINGVGGKWGKRRAMSRMTMSSYCVQICQLILFFLFIRLFILLFLCARCWRNFLGRCKLNFPIRNAHSFALFSSPSGFDCDFGRIQFSNFV